MANAAADDITRNNYIATNIVIGHNHSHPVDYTDPRKGFKCTMELAWSLEFDFPCSLTLSIAVILALVISKIEFQTNFTHSKFGLHFTSHKRHVSNWSKWW